MGSATNCCTHLVPAEAIKGKDEILSKYSEKDNKIDNNIIIKEIDSKSNSNNSNNNEIQVNSNQLPSNILELENKYNNNNNNNNNNNINSISSTYHNNNK